MNILKMLAMMIGVFALAIFGAPYVLGLFIVASVGHTPQGQAAMTSAAVISDKDLRTSFIEQSIARNAEVVRPSASVGAPSYTGTSETTLPTASVHSNAPGQPMMDPKPMLDPTPKP